VRRDQINSYMPSNNATTSAARDTLLVAVTLLPHLDLADFQLACTGCGPRGIPDVTSLPEIPLGGRRAVNPWLSALAVLEPAVGAADGHVQDQVEFLIEWCRVVAGDLVPGIGETGAVGVEGWEASALPERFVEVDVCDLEENVVDPGEEVFLRPFQSEGVFAESICGVESLSLVVCTPPCVVGCVWTPVKSGRHNVVSSLGIRVVVSTGFSNIDFSRQGPSTVGVVDRQHPDRWPQPISYWHLCSDLDTSVFDRSSSLGVDTSGLHRLYDFVGSKIRDGNAVCEDFRGTGSIGCQIDHTVGVDESSILQGRPDDEFAVLNENVRVVECGLLEFSIAVKSQNRVGMGEISVLPKSTNFSFLRPDCRIQISRGEIISEDWAVLVMHHRLQTIVNQETSNSEPQC